MSRDGTGGDWGFLESLCSQAGKCHLRSANLDPSSCSYFLHCPSALLRDEEKGADIGVIRSPCLPPRSLSDSQSEERSCQFRRARAWVSSMTPHGEFLNLWRGIGSGRPGLACRFLTGRWIPQCPLAGATCYRGTPLWRQLGPEPFDQSTLCLGGTWKRKRNVGLYLSQPREVSHGSLQDARGAGWRCDGQ